MQSSPNASLEILSLNPQFWKLARVANCGADSNLKLVPVEQSIAARNTGHQVLTYAVKGTAGVFLTGEQGAQAIDEPRTQEFMAAKICFFIAIIRAVLSMHRV